MQSGVTVGLFAKNKSALALVLFGISCFIAVQFLFIASIISIQMDGAHLVDVSGLQRMRTQRIAYSATALEQNLTNESLRSDLRKDASELVLIHHHLMHLPFFQAFVSRGVTEASLDGDISSYATAATGLALDPRRTDLLRYIDMHRVTLMQRIDETVHSRAALVKEYNTILITGVCANLLFLCFFITACWQRIIIPIEKRADALVRSLNASNQRLHSSLLQNSDAVFTIDENGVCIDVNMSGIRVFGLTRKELLGNGYLQIGGMHHIKNKAELENIFAQERSPHFPGRHRHKSGTTVEYECKITPILVEHELHGAYLIAHDTTAAKRMSRVIQDQATRTHALCLIASAKGDNESEQIDAALNLVLSTLDMHFAYVGRIEGDYLHIENAAGDRIVDVGGAVELGRTHVRETIAKGDVLTISDLEHSEARPESAPDYPGWHAYMATPLIIGGNVYGAIGFISKNIIAFNDYDRDFMRLVANLIATVVERREQKARLDKLAFYDVLTQLPNRAKFMRDLNAAIELGRRHERMFALHFIDLDGFKAVNDGAGHAVGDLALQEVAERMRQVMRAYDIPARLGGDEFVVIQAEFKHAFEAEALATRLIERLCEPYILAGKPFMLGASIGIATFPNHGFDARTLMQNADVALYRAKANGKGRFEMQTLEQSIITTL